MRIKVRRRCDQTILVIDSMALQLDAFTLIGEHLRNRGTQTAQNIMLLYGHQLAGARALRRCKYRVAIDRFDRRHVDDAYRPTTSIHCRRGFERSVNGDSAGDYG